MPGLFSYARRINDMKATVPEGIFKPSASRAEAKNDTTTKVAWGIIETESSQREAKTKRLREARLAMEAEAALNPPPPKAKPVRRPRKV